MKILLITFSFPPAGGVGVLRALSLAKYLPEAGVEVEVLTARNAPAVGRDDSLLRQVPATVRIHRTWTLDLPFAVRKRLKKLLTRENRPSAAPASDATRKPSLLSRLRTLVGNLLLPDPQIGWLPFALPAARRLIRRGGIDAVVITVPPFSSVKLAPALRKAFPALPIVVDFRDEWLTTTLSLVSFNANARARRVAERTERDAVHAASRVVLVTEAAVHELRRRYPAEDPAKFLAIPNGFDGSPARWSPPASADPVVLTYMGTVYGSTDPSTLVEAVAALPPDIRRALRLRFIGHIESERFRLALSSLGDTVELLGFVPQAEALQRLRASHFALLITHDPVNVSAKFYDYIGAGVPIVAAVHPEGDVRRLLEQLHAGFWADVRDPAAVAAMLVAAVTQARSGQPLAGTPPELASAFHRRPLAARYARLLESLATTDAAKAPHA